MKARIHAIAGTLALVTVATFLVSTLVSELALGHEAVAAVKTAILYGVCLLIPLMAATGGSGFSLASGRQGPLIDAKKRRMRFIAANGILIMLPAAVSLSGKASAGAFDQVFYTVQAVEIAGGALQICLLGLNFRDGLRMTEKKRLLARRKAQGTQ
jgi:hypothetical protein